MIQGDDTLRSVTNQRLDWVGHLRNVYKSIGVNANGKMNERKTLEKILEEDAVEGELECESLVGLSL